MLIELMAASLLLASSDPEGVVSTAPRAGPGAVPTASADALAATVGDASPAVTLQTAAPRPVYRRADFPLDRRAQGGCVARRDLG